MDSELHLFTQTDAVFVCELEASLNALSEVNYLATTEADIISLATELPPLIKKFVKGFLNSGEEISLYSTTDRCVIIRNGAKFWLKQGTNAGKHGVQVPLNFCEPAPSALKPSGSGILEIAKPTKSANRTAMNLVALDTATAEAIFEDYRDELAILEKSKELFTLDYAEYAEATMISVMLGPIQSFGAVTTAFIHDGGQVQITSAREEMVITYNLFSKMLIFWDRRDRVYRKANLLTLVEKGMPERWNYVLSELYDYLIDVATQLEQ